MTDLKQTEDGTAVRVGRGVGDAKRDAVYFLAKDGVYSHGVWWIGSNFEEGIKECDRRAELDRDSYHEWKLKGFSMPPDTETQEPEHEVLYIRTKEAVYERE